MNETQNKVVDARAGAAVGALAGTSANEQASPCDWEELVVLEPSDIARLVEKAIVHISCDLRQDYWTALEAAESTSPALEQLISNAQIAASERVPLCQDTGYVWVLLEVGGDVLVPADIFREVNTTVALTYLRRGLRKSLVCDALCDRSNTESNMPAFCEIKTVQSDKPFARLSVMLKGGGSDNASRVVMLPPGAGLDGVSSEVLAAVREKGANACPPLVIGVGVGATFDKVASLAKQTLLREIGSKNPVLELAKLEADLLNEINELNIGPGGFGGQPTALVVHIHTEACHIAALPVAINIGCSAMRSVSFDLLTEDSEGTGLLCSPLQKGTQKPRSLTQLNLPATPKQLSSLKAGDEVALYGTIYTMRDAGHARALEHLKQNGELPFNLRGQALFYAGPTEPMNDRPFGAIGPTTASRMDFATPALLDAGITVTLGKGQRSQAVIDTCKKTGSIYLAATGGAAAYLAQFVTASEPVAWEDLGTEALRKLTLEGLPAFVAIDATGATLWDDVADITDAENDKNTKNTKPARNGKTTDVQDGDVQ